MNLLKYIYYFIYVRNISLIDSFQVLFDIPLTTYFNSIQSNLTHGFLISELPLKSGFNYQNYEICYS